MFLVVDNANLFLSMTGFPLSLKPVKYLASSSVRLIGISPLMGIALVTNFPFLLNLYI
jgi:hypothetical protein